MARSAEIECDGPDCSNAIECPFEEDEEDFNERYFGDGWLTVYSSTNEANRNEFCSVDCLLDHFEGVEDGPGLLA